MEWNIQRKQRLCITIGLEIDFFIHKLEVFIKINNEKIIDNYRIVIQGNSKLKKRDYN